MGWNCPRHEELHFIGIGGWGSKKFWSWVYFIFTFLVLVLFLALSYEPLIRTGDISCSVHLMLITAYATANLTVIILRHHHTPKTTETLDI